MIPKLHYITEGNSSKEIIENIQKACSSGIELVQLSSKNIAEDKFLEIAKEAREITSYFQTRLIINEYYKIAKEIKADGVHFDGINSYSTKVRIHLYTWQTIGATANTLHDCKTIIAEELDYIVLSPFRSSSLIESLPKILGLNGYTLITEALKTETPIIGFGEINTNDVTEILKTGILGIAVSDAITQNFDSIKVFNQLLKASSTDEKRHTF